MHRSHGFINDTADDTDDGMDDDSEDDEETEADRGFIDNSIEESFSPRASPPSPATPPASPPPASPPPPESPHAAGADALPRSLAGYREYIESCDSDALGAAVMQLYRDLGGDGLDPTNERIVEIYDVCMHRDATAPHGINDTRLSYYRTQYLILMREVAKRYNVELDRQARPMAILAAIIQRLHALEELARGFHIFRESTRPHFSALYTCLREVSLVDADLEAMTQFRLAVHLVETHCYRERLRKKNSFVYHPITKPIRRRDGTFHEQFMYAYECPMQSRGDPLTIERFVNDLPTNPYCDERFGTLLDSGSLIKSVVGYLEGSTTALPVLRPDRHVFSYMNGIYDCFHNRFYEYGHPEIPDVVAANHFDYEFNAYEQLNGPFWPGDDEQVESDADLRAVDNDWFDIPTPNFDRIFTTQWRAAGPGVPEECVVENPLILQRFNWAFLGRAILFDVGELDNWQRHYFIIGESGTGKSIIANVLKRVYRPEDVGLAASQIERQFGLGQLYDKFIWIITELRRDFQLDSGDFLSMVCGEWVLIRNKYKGSLAVKWVAGGIAVGNENSAWEDTRGALSRRMIYNMFRHIIIDGKDDDLEKSVIPELPCIILKMARAYTGLVRWMADKGHRSLEKVWPSYYKESLRRYQMDSSPLEGFLSAGEMLFGNGLYMPERDFQKFFSEYCKRMNRSTPEYVV
jgi:hypothetical protein